MKKRYIFTRRILTAFPNVICLFISQLSVLDIDVTLRVRRNTQGSKYYWIFVFLGRTFVFWTEQFDPLYLGEFNQVCIAYVSAFQVWNF